MNNVIAHEVNSAAEEILTHCVLDQKAGLPDYQHLKEVLNNLAMDSIEIFCNTIKEKK